MRDHFSWHRRAQDCIAQGYLTNSKRPEALVKGVSPTHVNRGRGPYIWDAFGNRYLDFICGLGTNLIGYGNERITNAILAQAPLGFTHSLATTLEVEVAEKVKSIFPFIDCLKFLKTGTQVCDAAIRIARAATGRDLVLSEGYHGHGDDFVSLTPPALGVAPRERAIAKLSENTIGPNVAAVIVEPVMLDWSEARRLYLNDLRRMCTETGALLIFDEVITGFRFPKLSVSNYFGITPDLICLGKAMGGGMPLSVVGGKYSVMNNEYFISSTFAGETLSLAAAQCFMTLLQNKVFDVETLWKKGAAFLEEFNGINPDIIRIDGYPTRGSFVGSTLNKALFWQECCHAGILMGPSWFLSFPAAEELKNVIGTFKAIIGRIQRGEVKLEGELPRSPFAEKVRNG